MELTEDQKVQAFWIQYKPLITKLKQKYGNQDSMFDADDIESAAILGILKAIRHYNSPTAQLIFSSIVNSVLDYVRYERKQKSLIVSLEEGLEFGNDIIYYDQYGCLFIEEIERKLEANKLLCLPELEFLAPDIKKVFRLLLYGYSTREIMNKTGYSLSQVNKIIHDIRLVAREVLMQ